MTAGAFLSAVRAIVAEKPVYRVGGSGADGTCDCIGLVIGAVRRCGLLWAKRGSGAHSSNWAARYRCIGLRPLNSSAALRPGQLVFKAREPGEASWALPARYGRGTDYYHVGVVLSARPLRIAHCTGGKVNGCAVVRSLRGWTHAASLSLIKEDA